jgi:two-component system, OmpR family, sensor kinase
VKRSISFQLLLVSLYLGTVLPLLLLVGTLVYIEYRAFLIAEHTTAMQNLVRAIVERGGPPGPPGPTDPRRLAEVLAEQLQATDFASAVRDAEGRVVPPVLRGGPWLSRELHAAVRVANSSLLLRQGDREVALRAVLGPDGRVIATVESSFPHAAIAPDLALLTRWLILTISGAMLLAMLVAPLVAQRTVRPLRGLLHTVRRVGAGTLNERAPLPQVVEARELAQGFNRMLDQIEAAFQAQARTTAAMQRFAADASHELRSPLAVLHSGVDVLGMALQLNDREQLERTLLLLKQEVSGMSRLVDDLLLLARMDQPQSAAFPLRFALLAPLPIVEEAVERAQLLAAGQAVRLSWPTQPLPSVWADGEALRRVLNNLLENALRHTPAGCAITVELAVADHALRVVVRDQGSGIAAEHLPHVFERLGLAIVQAIVAAHGGCVDLASTVGVGTTVVIVLPLRASHELRAMPSTG